MNSTSISETPKDGRVPNRSISDNLRVVTTEKISSDKSQRNLGLDLLRVVATYMVMQIHTGEFYYIGSDGTVLNTANAYWVGWLNSLFRMCVPLFVMISGFFLFPINDERTFFRKRFSRVLIPFVVWCALYAFYFYFIGDITITAALVDILKIPINFGTDIGHLWFVYMLLGIYLIAPVLSPWVRSASRRSMEVFLTLWALTLTTPYIHLYFPQIWGECYWNRTPMLYYFSGFMGYAIMASYIKRFLMRPSALHRMVGAALIVTGYAITAGGFLHKLPLEHAVRDLELTWGFETINVAMMAVGLFLLFKNIQPADGTSACWKLISDISPRTYGMYLAHIMILNVVYALIDGHFGTTLVKLPLIALTTFATTYLIIRVLSLLPKSRWIVG
jgi:surface polysaccharide O-acyltransferase-like enzyme